MLRVQEYVGEIQNKIEKIESDTLKPMQEQIDKITDDLDELGTVVEESEERLLN